MDWKIIISELRLSGLTQTQIAAAVGVRQSTIAGLLAGTQTDMRWSNGERLKQLHEKTVLHASESNRIEKGYGDA